MINTAQLLQPTSFPAISRDRQETLQVNHGYRYLQLRKGAYREENLEGVMCRHLISVDWQGYVSDCTSIKC